MLSSYFLYNLAEALPYLIFPFLLLPGYKSSKKIIRLNLFLISLLSFMEGLIDIIDAFNIEPPLYKIALSLVSWVVILLLLQSQSTLKYLIKLFDLLDISWKMSLVGKILCERIDDDLVVIKINPHAERVFKGLLQAGELIGESMPGHKKILPGHSQSLLGFYIDALKLQRWQQIEFYYDHELTAWFLAIAVPLRSNLLYITFIEITALKKATFTDALTGLFNRNYTKNVHTRWTACIYIDLDRFKTINDQLGHKAGDNCLISVARILEEIVCNCGGIAVRHGGDEFLVLLENDEKAYEISIEILEKIQQISFAHVTLSASLGVATISSIQRFRKINIETVTLEELEMAAETAARTAKQDKRSNSYMNRIKVWNNLIAEKEQRLYRLDIKLNETDILEELKLVYQPVCDLKTGHIVGAEALLRWTSAALGPVPPTEFIPIAESNGVIYKLSDWLMTNAFSELKKLEELRPDFYIAINISPVELDNINFIHILTRKIAETGVTPSNVALEITERGIYDNFSKYIETLDNLRNISIRLKVDDFGTGISGLQQILMFKFDEVKIDRRFIPSSYEDEDQILICKTVVALSEGLKFNLVAEGVEVEAQKDLLIELGYTFGQGYYFSYPMTADELALLVARDAQLPVVT